MKKLLVGAVALFCATAIVVQAQDTTAPVKKAKKEMTAEQKTLSTEMLAKYDTNKDGKLDKKEKSAMSAEDKAAWDKAFPMKGKKKSADGATTDALGGSDQPALANNPVFNRSQRSAEFRRGVLIFSSEKFRWDSFRF